MSKRSSPFNIWLTIIFVVTLMIYFSWRRVSSEQKTLEKVMARNEVSDVQPAVDSKFEVVQKPHPATNGAPAILQASSDQISVSMSMEVARGIVNSSAPPSWQEFLDAKSVGQNRDSRRKQDPKQFVGYVEAPETETGTRFISLNFDGDKWTFCGFPEDGACWPPREVVEYGANPEVWTLYYPDGLRLFLRHIKGVDVPNHEGKQVLAGWLLQAGKNGDSPIARMALVNDYGADGSILVQLWPDTKP